MRSPRPRGGTAAIAFRGQTFATAESEAGRIRGEGVPGALRFGDAG